MFLRTKWEMVTTTSVLIVLKVSPGQAVKWNLPVKDKENNNLIFWFFYPCDNKQIWAGDLNTFADAPLTLLAFIIRFVSSAIFPTRRKSPDKTKKNGTPSEEANISRREKNRTKKKVRTSVGFNDMSPKQMELSLKQLSTYLEISHLLPNLGSIKC